MAVDPLVSTPRDHDRRIEDLERRATIPTLSKAELDATVANYRPGTLAYCSAVGLDNGLWLRHATGWVQLALSGRTAP